MIDFGCALPISQVPAGDFSTRKSGPEILSWDAPPRPIAESALPTSGPLWCRSPSNARGGGPETACYYNMRGKDISDALAKFDLFFKLCDCPTIAVGDGGNEIGMGNILAELGRLPIVPSVTPCDGLVIATVSNWGVYGIIAAMTAKSADLFSLFDPVGIVQYLVDRGAVDGKTGAADCTEDGFPLAVGLSIITRCVSTVSGLMK
jgi:hypothetical protein